MQNEIEAGNPGKTEDFLPSGAASCSPLFWVNIAWNPDENYTPEWETMTKERYQEEWSADDETWGDMVTAGAACLKLNEKPPQTEKGLATHQGGRIPWDVLPLLRYIANPKKYLEEMGYEDDECDMDWARSRANFMLAEHAKFHGENATMQATTSAPCKPENHKRTAR